MARDPQSDLAERVRFFEDNPPDFDEFYSGGQPCIDPAFDAGDSKKIARQYLKNEGVKL